MACIHEKINFQQTILNITEAIMPTSISSDSLTGQLEKLLAQSLASLHEQETHLYDELAGTLSESLVLFGAGKLGRKTLRGLRNHGIEPLAFTDNNLNLHGKQVDGLTVLTPTEAAHQYGDSALFLVTIYAASVPDDMASITRQLNSMGCKKVISFVPLYWKYAHQFLPHYVYDLPHRVIESSTEILNAFNLFHDHISREEFFAQINWRLDPTYPLVPLQAAHKIYFPPDLIQLTKNEVFIDCGAYSGDTIQSFLEQTGSQFNRLIAFEPDPINFQKLTELVNSLPNNITKRIQISDRAVGRDSRQLHFDSQGSASSSLSDSGEVIIYSEPLDTLIKDEAPTFIKMDIEGAELDALYGAKGQICKHLPILAISAYHSQNHIWRLPLLIKSLSESYLFFLRRYTPRFLDDLVLYAIPHKRLRHQ